MTSQNEQLSLLPDSEFNEFQLPIDKSQKEIKGNRGEWGEFYTFLRLIKDGAMFEHGDKTHTLHYVTDVTLLNPRPTRFRVRSQKQPEQLSLANLIEGPKPGKDVRFNDKDVYIFYADDDGDFHPMPATTIPKQRFDEACDALEEALIAHKKETGTFKLSKNHPAMTLLKELGITNIKADSLSKADIRVTHVIKRGLLSINKDRSYSIKSSLGSKATLFNAGKASNVTYQIVPTDPHGQEFTSEMADIFNSIVRDKAKKDGSFPPDIKKRMAFLAEQGFKLEYSHIGHEIFKQNIQNCFPNADKLIQGMLLAYYNPKPGSLKSSKISDFVANQVAYDPLELKETMNDDELRQHYEKMTKKVLLNMAMGMTAGKKFNQEELSKNITGGILLLEESANGYSLFARDIENSVELEDYLFQNTKLETASTSRHDFAHVYYNSDNGTYEVKLNLQVRLIDGQKQTLTPENESQPIKTSRVIKMK